MVLKRNKKRNSQVVIQLTALVDALTILVVFFLMQYSTDPEFIKITEDVNLPVSNNAYATEESKNVNVILSNDFIKVDGKHLMSLSNGKFKSSSLHHEDREFIQSFHNKINKNKELSEKKDFQWVLLADKKIPYETLKKTIYTLAISGYTKIKLASTVENQ